MATRTSTPATGTVVPPLTAAVARCLLDLDHLAFLADGGSWDELRFPLGRGGRAWTYRVRRSGVMVDASPAGPGRVPWPALTAIAEAGLTPERAKRVRALARLGWEKPTPALLRRAGLDANARASDVRRVSRAVTREVVDAGIAECGGEQLDLFGGAA
jgi:hypothetical protein